jgi:hypothetical protein
MLAAHTSADAMLWDKLVARQAAMITAVQVSYQKLIELFRFHLDVLGSRNHYNRKAGYNQK